MQKRRAKIPDLEHVIDSTINLWNEGSLLTLSQLVRRKSLDFVNPYAVKKASEAG